VTIANAALVAAVAHHLDAGSTVLRAWPLEGGVSARVTAIELIRSSGAHETVVLRQPNPSRLEENPRAARQEYTLLSRLHRAGLPVPAAIDLDDSGEVAGAPYLVMEYIDGAAKFAPETLDRALTYLAEQLVTIHAVDVAALDLPFLPAHSAGVSGTVWAEPDQPNGSWEEGRIRSTLQHVWPLPERVPPAVLHGDFRPGNVLWRHGRIVGVLDWENATLGDPLADLATSRLEMLWACGEDAMRSFTRRYLEITRRDRSSLPYWDLAIALRYGPLFTEWTADPDAQYMMRERHRWFIAHAFSVLDRQGRYCAPSVSSVADRDPGRRA
jgi:aminoglycoside phosphotransferase (APT) family kinase protein